MEITPPTKDCYTRQAVPDLNTNGIQLVVGGTSTSGFMRTYIGFDITNIPTTINNASIWLYQYTADGTANRVHEIRRTITSWNETEPTWNDPPTTTNTGMTTTNVSSAIGWYKYNIKDILIAESSNVLGIEIRDNNEGAGDELNTIFYSSEYSTDITKRAILEINSYYIKTSGNDTLDGQSWTNAWATVNKAATTVIDGSSVHIEHGTYNAEPAGNKIAPQNAGASGIGYKIHTTGGGTGTATVKVEKN